jgi:glucoamylase
VAGSRVAARGRLSRRLGTALPVAAALVAALLLASGNEPADPLTPPALPGRPPPFLGTAVVGSGDLTAAIDAYGDVVDLRADAAGAPLIDNPADRQAAGTVAADTGIVPMVRVGGGPARPMWTADAVAQRYRPGTNVLETVARFGGVRVRVVYAAEGSRLACVTEAEGDALVSLRSDEPQAAKRLRCDDRAARRIIDRAAADDRRWLQGARPLAAEAPAWAERMYGRSLLVLRALTARRNGAVAAGARDGWAYVWPRDAATAALAYAAAGYASEAKLATRFLLGLGIEQAARFHGDGSPVPGRAGQGDATGWVAAAAEATGLIGSARHAARILSPAYPVPWRGRADYREGEQGDFLANAIASGAPAERIGREFGAAGGLAREPDRENAFDSAAAWAIRPFPRPPLFEPVRRTLTRLSAESGLYGLLPGQDWSGGEDPWSAPTAWSAWSLAALGERRAALRLLRDLRRAATTAGGLPERVDAQTGIPTSTTPLAWSHAFAILALQELWPS